MELRTVAAIWIAVAVLTMLVPQTVVERTMYDPLGDRGSQGFSSTSPSSPFLFASK